VTITIDIKVVMWAVGLILAWSGMLVGVIKVLLARVVKDLDSNLEGYKSEVVEIRKDYQRLDADFKRLLIQLPIDYQRRDDSIREYTALNLKLDRMIEKFSGRFKEDA